MTMFLFCLGSVVYKVFRAFGCFVASVLDMSLILSLWVRVCDDNIGYNLYECV